MKPCRVFVGSALLWFCLTFGGAEAETITEFSDGMTDGSFSSGIATGADGNPPFTEITGDRMGRIANAALSELIFDSDFDGQENGGTTCATATELGGGTTYTGDTTAAPNWMSSFGPLLSPSNDVVYMFVAGPDVEGSIIPTASTYTFAMYLIPSCAESGSEPQPIGATATIDRGIDLLASGVTSGNTYYLVITGTAIGGPGANGTVNFTTPFSFAIPPGF